jgi:hypothetical protein
MIESEEEKKVESGVNDRGFYRFAAQGAGGRK